MEGVGFCAGDKLFELVRQARAAMQDLPVEAGVGTPQE
jgi:hypothetical protein